MKPGDIVLIRFPQTDLHAGKLRPALVIVIAPGNYGDVLIALISSRINQAIPEFDEVIHRSESDFSKTGLKVSSVIRLSRLATVDSKIITARLGRISSERWLKIKKQIIAWMQA